MLCFVVLLVEQGAARIVQCLDSKGVCRTKQGAELVS